MGNRQLINPLLKLETYRVSGHSMYPLLKDGQEISIQSCREYQVGDIVVVKHPIQSDVTIVKKIESIDSKGQFRLRGVNRLESSDRFGLIQKEVILGKVVEV